MSIPYSRSWVKIKHRQSPEYKQGVLDFIEFVKNHSAPDSESCSCPCKKCTNSRRQSFQTVKEHLILHGIEPTYDVWYLHGESIGGNKTINPSANPMSHISDQAHPFDQFPEEYHLEGAHENLVDGASGIHRCTESIGGINREKYHKYKEKASEKLYPSCEDGVTTLSVILELHNLKKEFNWSGNSVTELLVLLKKWLPKENKLPDKYPTMKRMIKDIGMNVKCIHACENDCILFWKENENAVECPICHTSRFKVKEKGKVIEITKQPRKVLKYFPIIPRLTRLYTVPSIARNMLWHSKAKTDWDFMRHPVDSAEWRSIQAKWPDFANNGRNLWLGIATDGFNPNAVMSSGYSCWPVYIISYNLPPSLCMKPEFQMMCLLIPGPKAPSQDIDVYLEPLVDELKELWTKGVLAYDMDKKENFTLRAILLWGIHDLPAFGNLSGCVTHGYKACPVCATETESERVGTKIVYRGYRRFLKKDHPYRGLKYGWYKVRDDNNPPLRLVGQSILQKLDHINYVPGKKTKTKKRTKEDVECDEEDFVTQNLSEGKPAWYKKSIFFSLPYWSNHKVRHTIDVMHTEKNVAEHFINFLFDRNKQHSQLSFDKSYKIKCCQVLNDAKLPSCFGTNLSNLVTINPPSLNIRKSYDFHVIIQYFLPIMIRHAYPKHRDLKRAILQICLYFSIICSKVLVKEYVQAAKYMIAEALCVLVRYFPANFFDISIHTMVHLADQALLCGPVNYIWMYPFERAMKDCKNKPSNKRYVEGSISEEYLVSESARYATEYLPNPHTSSHSSTQMPYFNEYDDVSEHSIVEGKKIKLSDIQRIQIRRWILFTVDIPDRDEYYSDYRSLIEGTQRSKKRPHTQTEVVTQTKFIEWLQEKLIGETTKSMLWHYVNGISWEAKTYLKYSVNGYVFSPQHHDNSTQDSGVCMDAITTFVASTKDSNPIDDDTTWYGIIKEIIEVDYYAFQHVVFYCDWINIADKTNACKICPDSHLLTVNLKKIKSSEGEYDEPAILASEASQVFYIKDTHDSDWSIVRHSPKRMNNSIDNYELARNFQSILKEQPNLKSLLTCIEPTV